MLALQVFKCTLIRLLESTELGGKLEDLLLGLLLLLFEIVRVHHGNIGRILGTVIIHNLAGICLLELLHPCRDISVTASTTGSLGLGLRCADGLSLHARDPACAN
jgi:hypothetical protein